jgi:hypothetical protein
VTRHRRPLLDARAALLVLGLALAGSFVGACQANNADQPTVGAGRRPTPEQAVKLIAAIGTYEEVAQFEAAVQPWKQRERILSALHNWDHFQALVRAQANRAARIEFVAFVTATRNPATGSIGALGVGGVLAAPRIVPGTLFALAEANQCAFVLPGQEPLSRPALRWARTGDAIEEEEPPLSQQVLDALDPDPGPIPMTDEEIQAYEDWRSENSAPIPMTEEESAWAAQQRADSGAPYPMTDEEIQAIKDAAGTAPPFTEELLNWIDQYEQDSAPIPMTEEESAWAAQQRADSGAPYPMTDEEAGWVDQWESVDDGAPVPMTEEESAWAEQQRADSGAPYPMDDAQSQAYETWLETGEPIPMTPEEIAWAEQQRADSGAPYPMTDEEIAAVDQAIRDRTLNLTEEEWDWIREQSGIGSPSSTPQPTPQRCDWFVDAGNAYGHVKGQKCGGAAGTWILNGDYHPPQPPGFRGTQKWTITIGSDWRTGTFTYETRAEGQVPGVPITVYLIGFSEGTVTLTIRDDGIAHMEFAESKHTFLSTTSAGGAGADQDAPLQTYQQDWAVGGTC